MSLPPGTRIPEPEPVTPDELKLASFDVLESTLKAVERAWWRDKAAIFAAAFALGLLTGACLAALAWAHMGG